MKQESYWSLGVQSSHPNACVARVGDVVSNGRPYPFFCAGNVGFRVCQSVLVDDGLVQVVSDGSGYEWIWFREDGSLTFTRDGWGSESWALREALNVALGGVDRG